MTDIFLAMHHTTHVDQENQQKSTRKQVFSGNQKVWIIKRTYSNKALHPSPTPLLIIKEMGEGVFADKIDALFGCSIIVSYSWEGNS